MKMIDSMIQTCINNGCKVIKDERRTLETYRGNIIVYDIRIIKNDYVFTCFGDEETVIKNMKIDRLI